MFDTLTYYKIKANNKFARRFRLRITFVILWGQDQQKQNGTERSETYARRLETILRRT